MFPRYAIGTDKPHARRPVRRSWRSNAAHRRAAGRCAAISRGGDSSAPPFLYCHDGNKNVSEIVSTDGVIDAHYEYSSFGKVVMVTSENVDGAVARLNPYGFSSEYHDDALRLVYYNYRHYNPGNGRWINRDTIEEIGGLNVYGMVNNNAFLFFDKDGAIGVSDGVKMPFIPYILSLATQVISCYNKVIDSAGNYGNRDGYAHCVVACNFNNCLGGMFGRLGKVDSALITFVGTVVWEAVSGWERDAEDDINSGVNGIIGSVFGMSCEDACKCEGSNMP